MTLRNLMHAAYQRELRGEPDPIPRAAAAASRPVPRDVTKPGPAKLPSTGEALAAKPRIPELEKLVSLRDHGVLTEEEFQAARKRLSARA
jgi:hypothetical protein